MAGGDDEVLVFGKSSEVGKSVGRTWSKTDPGFEVGELRGFEFRVEAAEGLDDALQAGFADGGIAAADFHGAGDAELVSHRSDGDAAFLEERTEERVLGGAGRVTE